MFFEINQIRILFFYVKDFGVEMDMLIMMCVLISVSYYSVKFYYFNFGYFVMYKILICFLIMGLLLIVFWVGCFRGYCEKMFQGK